MRWRLLLPLLVLSLLGGLPAAEVIPAAPRDHFNDYAALVSSRTAQALEAELTQLERDSSNQILVAIYPHMTSDSSIEDYTVRVAQAWGVGQKGKKNGAVLFIFSADHKLYIQVGYGLEGVLPDALCKQIIANEITPRFRTGDYTGGVQAGVHALIAATRGEYQGTGQTVADGRTGHQSTPLQTMVIIFVFGMLFFVRWAAFRNRGSSVYGRNGRTIFPGGGWSGGGGSSGGGGGSFSGGGGSFGGGGAGGSW